MATKDLLLMASLSSSHSSNSNLYLPPLVSGRNIFFGNNTPNNDSLICKLVVHNSNIYLLHLLKTLLLTLHLKTLL